jgi:hypothetical protein
MDETKEDVFCAYVVVAQLESLAQRQLEDLLGTGREWDVARRRLRTLADDLDNFAAYRFEIDVERFKGPGSNTFTLMDETKEDVFCAYVIVVE